MKRFYLIIAALSLVILLGAGYLWSVNSSAPAPSQSARELKLKGEKLYSANKYRQSLEYLERYLALKPKDWRVHEMVSDIYWRDGNEQKAYSELRRAHDINGPRADRAYKLGLLATTVSKDIKAVEYLLKSVELKPKSMLFRIELAKAYVKREKYKKAVLEWQAAIETLPENDIYAAVIYAELGDTFQLLGEAEKAKEAYLRGLAAEPDNLYLKDQASKIGS